jgi:hypothetical protein
MSAVGFGIVIGMMIRGDKGMWWYGVWGREKMVGCAGRSRELCEGEAFSNSLNMSIVKRIITHIHLVT